MVKNPFAIAGYVGSIPVLGRSPGEGDGNPLVFLPGEFHGQSSLVGYSSWGCKESDTTERLTLQKKNKKINAIQIVQIYMYL